jgi:hypothetical protein
MLKPRDKAAAAGATGAVVITIAFGFFFSGSPQTQRLLSADDRRLTDLYNIANRLRLRPYSTALPAGLSELSGNSGVRLSDPLTNQPYEYRRGQGTQYTLCATFSLASPEEQRQETFWTHPAGRHCFSLDSSEQPPIHTQFFRAY